MKMHAALTALILLAGAPLWAQPDDGKAVAFGNLGAMGGGDPRMIGSGYDGGCTGGSCGVVPASGRGDINQAADGASRTGGLFMAKSKPREPMVAEVPAPSLKADKAGDKSKKGSHFFDFLGSKGFLFGAGGAAVGAGVGFLLGGPIGALIGAAVGGLGGWLLSKFL